MGLIGKIRKNIQKINEKLNLLKEDIDVYACRFEWANKFPKGYQNYSYRTKFLKLFFANNCFRYVFYFRIGRMGKFLKPIFNVPYDSTFIWSNPEGVEGGGASFLCMRGVQC